LLIAADAPGALPWKAGATAPDRRNLTARYTYEMKIPDPSGCVTPSSLSDLRTKREQNGEIFQYIIKIWSIMTCYAINTSFYYLNSLSPTGC
jgi:hypothetical protein